MEKGFLKGKGFYLLLSLCVIAAALSCFWAVRSIANNMNEATSQLQREETKTWDMPGAKVENKQQDVPLPSEKPKTQQPSSRSSSSRAASQQPSQGQSESGGQDVSAKPSFVAPVSGSISQRFSGDELVYNKTLNDWRTHNGVDITCQAGEAVKSATDGTVVNIYEDGMWGKIVEIENGDLVWRYAGLDAQSITANVGDTLQAGHPFAKVGEILAEVGEGPHLHIEVLKGGNCMDPEHYFG